MPAEVSAGRRACCRFRTPPFHGSGFPPSPRGRWQARACRWMRSNRNRPHAQMSEVAGESALRIVAAAEFAEGNPECPFLQWHFRALGQKTDGREPELSMEISHPSCGNHWHKDIGMENKEDIQAQVSRGTSQGSRARSGKKTGREKSLPVSNLKCL